MYFLRLWRNSFQSITVNRIEQKFFKLVCTVLYNNFIHSAFVSPIYTVSPSEKHICLHAKSRIQKGKNNIIILTIRTKNADSGGK